MFREPDESIILPRNGRKMVTNAGSYMR